MALRSRLFLPLVFLGLAASLSAQSVDLSTPGAWTQTWFGCDPGRSCVWVKIDAAPVEGTSASVGITSFRVWSFFHSGTTSIDLLQWWGCPGWCYREGEFAGIWDDGYYFEGWESYDNQQNMLPVSIDAHFVYVGAGENGDDLFTGTRSLTKIAESVTAAPEPATLLLVGTGLAGLLTARRRRRSGDAGR